MKARIGRLGLALSGAVVVVGMFAQSAFAAADPITGIDWTADLADPLKAALLAPLAAGVTIFVMFAAVSGARKLWSKITRAS